MATPTKARVVLGQRPATIRRTISADLPTGSTGIIDIDYRFRTRTDYGSLLDARMGAAKSADAERAAASAAAVAAGGDPLPPLTAGELQSLSVKATAEHILDIATGWSLPEPFDLQHVQQLCDELPGVAAAIVDEYRLAIIEGRRGN